MNGKYFIDTNIFIYQLESIDKTKFTIANQIIRDGIKTGNACISYQVIQECINTIIRKAEIPLDTQGAQQYLQTVLSPLFRMSASLPLYQRGLTLKDRFGYGFYDSMIIAAALEIGCVKLISEDLQHGQRIENLVIENPFIE